MKKKGKKDKKDKQEELKEVNKPRWWIHTIVDSIIDWLSVLLIATVLSSCMSQSNEEKPSIDYDDNLEQLLQNPGLLNNSEANTDIFNQFIDSGSFNSDNQKNGTWTEYNIEDSFSNIPVTIISASGDTTKVERTVIAKYVGEYENGKRVGGWKRYTLMNTYQPFEWQEKKIEN